MRAVLPSWFQLAALLAMAAVVVAVVVVDVLLRIRCFKKLL